MKWILALSILMMTVSSYAENSNTAYDMLKKVDEHIYFLSEHDDSGERIGHGTGFKVLDAQNQIRYITAGHVCDGTPFLKMRVSQPVNGKQVHIGTVYEYRISKFTDLCEIKIRWLKPQSATGSLKLAKTVIRDEYVFIVGYPKMPFISGTWGRLKGLEAVHLPAPWADSPTCLNIPKYHFHGLICYMEIKAFATTAPTAGGGSGSPLLNSDGEVIAVVVASGGRIPWSSSTTMQGLKRFLVTP